MSLLSRSQNMAAKRCELGMQLERLFQEHDEGVQKALAALCHELGGVVSNICSSVSMHTPQLHRTSDLASSSMLLPTVSCCMPGVASLH